MRTRPYRTQKLIQKRLSNPLNTMATATVVPGPQERLRDFRARGEDLERHCLKLRAKGELHPAVTPYDAPATEDVENVTVLGGPEALDELLRVRMRSMAIKVRTRRTRAQLARPHAGNAHNSIAQAANRETSPPRF